MALRLLLQVAFEGNAAAIAAPLALGRNGAASAAAAALGKARAVIALGFNYGCAGSSS